MLQALLQNKKEKEAASKMMAEMEGEDKETYDKEYYGPYYCGNKMIIDKGQIIICSICNNNSSNNNNNCDNKCCACVEQPRRNTTTTTTTTTTTEDEFASFKDFSGKPKVAKKEKKRVTFLEDVEVPVWCPQPPVPSWPVASAAAAAKQHHHVVGHHVVVGVVGAVCY